jgi:hypothetical protein
MNPTLFFKIKNFERFAKKPVSNLIKERRKTKNIVKYRLVVVKFKEE